jgi:hypothetical protein
VKVETCSETPLPNKRMFIRLYRFVFVCGYYCCVVGPIFHSSMALQLFVGPWPLHQFRNLFYTDGGTSWTIDQPVARPLPTRRTTQTQNKRTHRHPCLEWDSSPRSQRSSRRRQFIDGPIKAVILAHLLLL